jgi:hypothetical protein
MAPPPLADITQYMTTLPRRPARPPREKNAALFRQVAGWAQRTSGGHPDPAGELAGITWLQRYWHSESETGLATCCIAGGAVKLTGGQFVKPFSLSLRPADGRRQLLHYTACIPAGSRSAWNVATVAADALGLDLQERSVVFSPHRTLAELTAMIPLFDANAPIKGDVGRWQVPELQPA